MKKQLRPDMFCKRPDICSLSLRVDVVGIGGGSLFVHMIDTPHPVHTHSRSSLYIY